MEGAAWEYDALGTELGNTIISCSELDGRPIDGPRDQYGLVNIGALVGEVVSSAAYLPTYQLLAWPLVVLLILIALRPIHSTSN